mmetsp:Transcript_20054/g.25980  ORF Transcript_20054/g.25980 Transcript_20054/m.25980 type:complete len:498 (+) Transcript_20054:228-1721(+)
MIMMTCARRHQSMINKLGRRYSSITGTDKGYQSIGSFHGENPEFLNGLSEEEYVPPELPFETKIKLETYNENLMPIGGSSQIKESHFMLETSWTFINHGAFGGALRCADLRALEWRQFQEKQPLRFFDRYLLPQLVYSNRLLSRFIGAEKPTSTVLIPNVTSGMNSVLAGYARQYCKTNECVVVIFNWAYGSVKNMSRVYCGERNVYEVEITKGQKCPNPVSMQDIKHSLLQTLDVIKKQRGNGILHNSLLILDHVTSNTALKMPISSLAKIAKEEGMLVLVDGAHGLLNLDLDMEKLANNGVDFYITNAHKWFSSPRGTAIMYCRDVELQESILRQPAIISHGIDDGLFNRFVWDGCRDYTSMLSIPMALDYWEMMGPKNVRKSCTDILERAIKILSYHWHKDEEILSKCLYAAPEMLSSSMALVRLPDHLSGLAQDEVKTSADAKKLQDFLYRNRIEVPIKCIDGHLFVRISCHVYNKPENYVRLSNVIMEYSDN